MPVFELIAPLVMNVLPPAIDYFLCQQGGNWQDEDEASSSFMKISSTCCSSMSFDNATDDDDTIVISSSEAAMMGKKRSFFPPNPRAVASVSSLSLDASDEDRGDDDEFVNTSWYCFTTEGLDQDGLSPIFG